MAAVNAHEKVFRAAVELVLKDDGFSIPSRPAVRARELAKGHLEWSSKLENAQTCRTFSTELIGSLEGCCVQHHSVRLRREWMWENYFKLRSSEEFKQKWVQFLAHYDARGDSCPTFFQFVTDALMEEIVKRTFPVESIHQAHQPSLDHEELNAVWYTAGYIIQALCKKIQRSAHPLKPQLILCLTELTECDGTDSEHPSEEWLIAINRGGLKHVNDITYMFFSAMELALRRELNSKKRCELPDLTQFIPVVERDDDVAFYILEHGIS